MGLVSQDFLSRVCFFIRVRAELVRKIRKLFKDFNEAVPEYEKWNDRARRLRRS